MLKYIILGVIGFAVLYCVDSFLPYNGELKQSTLRIKSSIDQFFILENMQDEEDLAELGTGRMAQIIPKMDLLFELNKEWTGFGFLHPEKTTMSKYIIYNPLLCRPVEERGSCGYCGSHSGSAYPFYRFPRSVDGDYLLW